MDQALQTFFAECRELLQQMEDLLLQLESAPNDAEAINALFRAAHTIKGSAGLFSLDFIVAFTHTVENLLDLVREGRLPVNTALVADLLLCRDHIEQLVEQAAQGHAEPEASQLARGDALTAQLKTYTGGPSPEAVPAAAGMPAPSAEPHVEASGGGIVSSDTWHISLRFGRDVLRNGMDPLSFIRYLGTLGEVVSLHTLPDALPPADTLDPESCYLGFEIDLKSGADKKTLEEVFEFVRDDCQLHILPPRSKVSEYLELIRTLPEEDALLGEILVKSGAITRKELDEGLASQWHMDAPLGQILVEQQTVQQPVVDAALEKQRQVKETRAQESRFVRVQADKLDALINLVGELVIAGASANLLAQRSKDGALQEATSIVSGLVEDIRDGALKLRMVEIGETFNRFQRVVRDVSKELGKDIGLEISGAETELDKTVVEKIGDPLMHLLRNSMDHGIEAQAVRQARGKAARGVVKLHAYHDSGSIVIEVGDDGGGLNRDKIFRKAVERGLVKADQVLGDGEVYKLIFEPGFSTADQVTNLSGRGVGMDVVKRNIESLRGSVEIDSQEGVGTTTRIRLPLTLAIIDGFLVSVGSASFVVPLDMVQECVELNAEQRESTRGRSYINLRGDVLPFVRLKDQFELEGAAGARENIVVVQYGNQKAGLVVDELLGEFQTVIKPLGSVFRNLKGISGSTILGSGEVALILDVPSLVGFAASQEAQAVLQPQDRPLFTSKS
ncbi:MAG: chemotaxis protein CheA [Betaproteobacteria bacterium]|nr:chemotaxis protein CheA [Betaproteobacteria bacterium]